MLIQCLVNREGDSQIVKLEGRRYKFARNEQGDMVCEVHNQEHIRWMLKSASYQEYLPPQAVDPPAAESPELRIPMGELAGQTDMNQKPARNSKRKAA
jgi:hypothetical protein